MENNERIPVGAKVILKRKYRVFYLKNDNFQKNERNIWFKKILFLCQSDSDEREEKEATSQALFRVAQHCPFNSHSNLGSCYPHFT